MTPDPAGLAAVDPSNPQSWNRYAYVMNDPMDYIDPSGMGRCQRATPDGDGYCPGNNLLGGSLDGMGPGGGGGFNYIWIPGDSIITDSYSDISDDLVDEEIGFSADAGYWLAIPIAGVPSTSDNTSGVHGWAYYFFTTNPFPTAWKSLKSENGCGHIIAETFLSDLSPVPVEASPSIGDAIPFAGKATAAAGLARASAYSLSRGLVQPLKSGTYRALRGSATVASDAVEELALPATIVYGGTHALVKSISAAAQGECH